MTATVIRRTPPGYFYHINAPDAARALEILEEAMEPCVWHCDVADADALEMRAPYDKYEFQRVLRWSSAAGGKMPGVERCDLYMTRKE